MISVSAILSISERYPSLRRSLSYSRYPWMVQHFFSIKFASSYLVLLSLRKVPVYVKKREVSSLFNKFRWYADFTVRYLPSLQPNFIFLDKIFRANSPLIFKFIAPDASCFLYMRVISEFVLPQMGFKLSNLSLDMYTTTRIF